MYQLQEQNSLTNRTNLPFLEKQLEQEGPTKQRQCTDIICLILFLAFVGAFIGIMIYAFVAGNPKSVISVHNSMGKACFQQSGYKFGYFPIPGQVKYAMCVNDCPLSSQRVNCLIDGVYCLNGTYKAPSNYSTFSLLQYCVPAPQQRQNQVTQYFDYNIVIQWVFNIQDGYYIVAGAAGAAIILAIIYSCFLRCLTGCILYTALVVIEIILIGVGILLILEAQGVDFTHKIPINLARLSVTELHIAGSVLIALALIFLIVIICLCSKLQLGVKVVETAAIFISERFYMIITPILSSIFIFATIAALIAGGIYIYGTGSATLTSPNAFFMVDFNAKLITLFAVFGFAGFWMICWIFYSNTFVVISAASIWYYQQDSPLCTSIFRLLRYHTGSLAFTSLLFGILFILRFIAKFFHLRNQESQNKCVNLCINLGTFCLTIFDQILKFLSDGVFVQIAMKSTNYCTSTFAAFKLLVENPIKIALTGAISYMVAILGIVFCTSLICTAAYFIQTYIPYYSQIITDPVPVIVFSGFASIIISGIYLSILADAAQAIIQCYLIQQNEARQKGISTKFAPQHLKMILENHISG